MDRLAFQVAQDATGTVLMLGGEIDAAAVDELRRCLTAGVTVVDMREVTFLDSSGLGVLLAASRRRTSPLRLRAPSPRVERLLQLSGTGPTFVVDNAPADGDGQ